MRELLKAAARFYWAMTLFGAKQFGAALSDRDSERTTSAFNSLARVFGEELSGMLKSVYQAGDSWQRGLCDLGPALLTPNAYTARGLTSTALSAMRQSANLLAAFAPRSDVRSALREFQTKIEVFDLFENVDTKLRLPSAGPPPLEELVERSEQFDTFTAVWVMEGIGHYYCETAWDLTGTPYGLLTGVSEVPPKILVPLHAGMGLSLANRLLGRAARACRRCPVSASLTDVLQQFVLLCKANSREAYLGTSYEALGLVARNLHPHLVAEIDRGLVQMDENLIDYFWHGVGRAIYFAPTNYVPLPGSARRVVELTKQEPPHETGRRNALAGVSWAMVLVNLREPEIIEDILVHCDGLRFDDDAFANGVSSAAIVWLDATESAAELEALCEHQLAGEHSGVAERWNTVVQRPCRRVLDQYYVAGRNNCIGEVFRYQPLYETTS
jgi:hypothetical protein